MLRVVVLVSGGGTNLQAILDAIDNGKIKNAEVVGVISNNASATSTIPLISLVLNIMPPPLRRHTVCLSDYTLLRLFLIPLLKNPATEPV